MAGGFTGDCDVAVAFLSERPGVLAAVKARRPCLLGCTAAGAVRDAGRNCGLLPLCTFPARCCVARPEATFMSQVCYVCGGIGGGNAADMCG